MSKHIVTNDRGGKRSYISTRMDLVPPKAWLRIGEILKEGAQKYGDENWRLWNSRILLNHALTHAANHLDGRTDTDHLGHCACRVIMALEMYLIEQQEKEPRQKSGDLMTGYIEYCKK